MTQVWVTNNTDEPLTHLFAGESYSFPVGRAVEVSFAAAQHIFGYELPDRTPMLARMGWARTANDVPRALERLDKFEIAREAPQQDEPKLKRIK